MTVTALVAAATVHPSYPDAIVFVVSAVLILAGAFGVVLARNPVHAALMLVMTLFGIAVLFVEQEADFLAAVQVIVYAGAIVVLFLFVIMFLGVDRREDIEAEPLRAQRPLAIALMAIAVAGVVALSVDAHWVTGAHTVTRPIGGHYGEVGQLGKSVFTNYLFAFEATAALLVIAVVGAVVLARRPATPAEPDDVATPVAPGGRVPALDAHDDAARDGAARDGAGHDGGGHGGVEGTAEPASSGAGEETP